MSQRTYPHASFLSAFTYVPHTDVHQDDAVDDAVIPRETAGRWSRPFSYRYRHSQKSGLDINQITISLISSVFFCVMRWLAPCPAPQPGGPGFFCRVLSSPDIVKALEARLLPLSLIYIVLPGSPVAEVWHMTCSVAEPVWDGRHFFALLRAT